MASPNVVVIETDDQTLADLASMPETQRLIGDAGVTFTDSVVSLSQCCPSRATFLIRPVRPQPRRPQRRASPPNTAAHSPYSVSLATRTASSVPSTGTIVTTGPNDSSP